MQQHAASTVPADGVLIIPEESSGKYLLSVITVWLSLQGNFIVAVAFIYPGSIVIKLFCLHFCCIVSELFCVQAVNKQATLINNLSVPTGRDEELVPSAHANNDATFCIFSK